VLWGRIPRGNGGRVAAVLLVDNAAQPMQAAPVAALKGIAVSGNASKLHVIFTHFDQVKGNNLPGFGDREQHVLASLENVLKSIGDELGPAAERVLRRRIDQARFFVGGIQDPLDAKKKAGSRSIHQLDAALNLLADPELAADAGPSRPVFNRMNLSLAVMEAAKTFHTRWRGILGLDYNPDTHKTNQRLAGNRVIPDRLVSLSDPDTTRSARANRSAADRVWPQAAAGRRPARLPRRHQLAQATGTSLTGPPAQTAYCAGAAMNRWWHPSEQK
jgi:hypothetical protein